MVKLWLNYFLYAKALWTWCVSTEAGESQAQPLPSWGDQICFELQLSRCGKLLVTAHHGLVLPLPSCGYHHHHTSARRTRCATPWKYRRVKPYRKWALVNSHWFGRMWPVVGSSWKRWHFTPAQDSIPDYNSCPLTNIRGSLPKKEIIWDSFGSLNWLTTVSEKHQDKEVAGKRILPLAQQHCHPTQQEPDWLWDPDPSGPLVGAAWGIRKGDVHHDPRHAGITWSHSYHQHMGKNKGTKTFPNTLVLVFAPLHSSLQKLLTFIFKRTFYSTFGCCLRTAQKPAQIPKWQRPPMLYLTFLQ